MATDKSYSELKEEADKILKKWQPIIDKCGHLEELDEKLILAQTLEKFRNAAAEIQLKGHVLNPEDTLIIVNPTKTNRLVISYDETGSFKIVHQHTEWIDDKN